MINLKKQLIFFCFCSILSSLHFQHIRIHESFKTKEKNFYQIFVSTSIAERIAKYKKCFAKVKKILTSGAHLFSSLHSDFIVIPLDNFHLNCVLKTINSLLFFYVFTWSNENVLKIT